MNGLSIFIFFILKKKTLSVNFHVNKTIRVWMERRVLIMRQIMATRLVIVQVVVRERIVKIAFVIIFLLS